MTLNSQVNWGDLHVDSYVAEHYSSLRDDDGLIIDRMAEFFASYLDVNLSHHRRGVDVGTGGNLYPAFALLPFANSVDLLEKSPNSVAWIRQQRQNGFSQTWNPFLERLKQQPVYSDYFEARDVRADFRAKTDVRVDDALLLPAKRWDLGTMFFTACSLSNSEEESNGVVWRFVESLKPGSPFVIASMANSSGYVVDDVAFPAVSLTEESLQATLNKVAVDIEVTPIRDAVPVRPGVYMLLATGLAA